VEGHRYSDPGYPDQGYSDAGYSDPGYSDGAGWQPDRGNYSDRGYSGESRYAPAGDYAVGEQRRAEPEPTRPISDAGRGATLGPRSGLPIPEDPARRSAVAPGSPGPTGPPSMAGPTTPASGPTGETYRSKRPAAAAVFGVMAVVLEIPALLLLREATFGEGPISPSGVISALCVVAGLPLLAVGLYAVATGAVRAAGPNSAQAWLRPPVAYLSVSLVLFIAAGLAA
jgi:hypothetical protein